MSLCSYSAEYNKNTQIAVDSDFISQYMTECDGDAARVYLYGLFICRSGNDATLKGFSDALGLSPETIVDYFKYWEEYDLVAIISNDPFAVKYLPLNKNGKPRKFKPEKYTDFTLALQALVPERMISTSEYTAYFSVMESFSIKPEAMLMICKYCIDIKGKDIGYKYITTVAKDFAYRGIVTVELIEKELADYNSRSDEISAVISAMGLRRKAETEDQQLYKKWRFEFDFEQKAVLYALKRCKCRNFRTLDKVMCEFYADKAYSERDMDNYVTHKELYRETAKNVCRALSVYVEIIDPVVENYISPWLSKGFDADTLLFVATYCFKKNRRTLEKMDEQIAALYAKGLVTLVSIKDYVDGAKKTDDFISALLLSCGNERRPTENDRNSVYMWHGWGFTDEMIREAASFASGKSNPIVYINAVLSQWKSKNIFSPDKISRNSPTDGKTQHFAAERTLSKEDVDALVKDIDDIDF